MAVIAATNSAVAAQTGAGSSTGVDSKTLANNFTQFLQLLTTQLKNQNPLDPLDTNQFTQQLVQFAQVEQQLKSNDQLATLVSLQTTAQATQALEFVGKTVAVDGTTSKLTDSGALWNLNVPKPAVGSITITNENGQQVYTGSFTMNTGAQEFFWDGKDGNGVQLPQGNYKLSVSAKDASGQTVAVPIEVMAPVDSADLTKTPPILSVAGQDYTLDKVKRVIR